MYFCLSVMQDPAVTEATSATGGGEATEEYNPFSEEAKKPEVCLKWPLFHVGFVAEVGGNFWVSHGAPNKRGRN